MISLKLPPVQNKTELRKIIPPVEPSKPINRGSLISTIGQAITNFRKDKLRLSRRGFAEKLGISRHALKIVEGGQSPDYSVGLLEKILGGMGTGLWDFLGNACAHSAGGVSEGSVKGEFHIEHPGDGLKLTSFTPRHKEFFFGLMQVKAKKSASDSKLPKTDYVLFQGFQGKLVFSFNDKEYLLSEEKNLLFRYPAIPNEIYNPDQIRDASCLLFTVPGFI